jgi:hypothetical protein
LEQKAVFLKAYAKNPLNVSKVCSRTKIHRSTVYTWLQKDEAFKAEYDMIRMALIDDCEECVFVHARKDPGLALKILERLNPEVYSLKVREELCLSTRENEYTDFIPNLIPNLLPKSED